MLSFLVLQLAQITVYNTPADINDRYCITLGEQRSSVVSNNVDIIDPVWSGSDTKQTRQCFIIYCKYSWRLGRGGEQDVKRRKKMIENTQ